MCANGDKYEGGFVDGRREGQGTLWVRRGGGGSSSGKSSGSGGGSSGAGRLVVRYSGDWLRDRPHGRGMLVEDDGGTHEGEFVGGRREGVGRAVYVTPASRSGGGGGGGSADCAARTGISSSCSCSSSGIAGAAGAAAGAAAAPDVYEGEFVADARHGVGSMTYGATGDVYTGQWAHGRREGEGSMVFARRGRRFDGVWCGDAPRAGAYSEARPAPPGAAGALPTVELAAPGAVLRDAKAAAAAAAGLLL